MGATTKQTGGALPALTSIRFIAALTVVLSHYTALGLLGMPKAFTDFVDGGRSAVSLFFVLSGFILTYTYREPLARGGPRSFYIARVARIYPVVLLGLALVAPTIFWLLHTGDSTRMLDWFALKNSVSLSLAVSLVCQLLLLNAWLPFAAINQPWNGPSDSVSCEAFFYTVFPFLLKKVDGRGLRFIMLVCFCAWLMQGAGMMLIENTLSPARSGFLVVALPLLRIAEFMLGVGAGFVFMHMRDVSSHRQTRGMVLVTVASVALIALSLWRPVMPAFYVQSPFFAMLILGLALMDRPVFGLLNSRWLVRLGEASYSLYLIHVPIAYLTLLAGFNRTNGWMVLIFVVWTSIVVFGFYEEPMRRAVRARLSQTREPGLASLRRVED